jgi:hypothetical protein
MGLVAGKPGGREVVQALHKEMGLGHEQQYKPIPKISWSELKDAYRGSWVIIQYAKGTGAIKQQGGSYEAMASTGGEVKKFADSRGGNILDFLKANAGGGNPIKYFSGTDTGKTKELKGQRKSNKQELEKTAVASPDQLIKKFRPLWVNAMTIARDDVKGMVVGMIKNDAFEKAERKLSTLKRLENALMNLEADKGHTPDFLNSTISHALYLAAGHFYPDQTGEIRKSYHGYSADSDEGMRMLLKDIGAGDQKKLGAVLTFFKRGLVAA